MSAPSSTTPTPRSSQLKTLLHNVDQSYAGRGGLKDQASQTLKDYDRVAANLTDTSHQLQLIARRGPAGASATSAQTDPARRRRFCQRRAAAGGQPEPTGGPAPARPDAAAVRRPAPRVSAAMTGSPAAFRRPHRAPLRWPASPRWRLAGCASLFVATPPGHLYRSTAGDAAFPRTCRISARVLLVDTAASSGRHRHRPDRAEPLAALARLLRRRGMDRPGAGPGARRHAGLL